MNVPKASSQQSSHTTGFTLLEMSIVIMVMLGLIGSTIMVFGNLDKWTKGREASETLRTVHSAQRMFLADHPTRLISSLTYADILPYMPNSPESMPTIESLKGVKLKILVNLPRPFADDGNGVPYDPSGNNEDSLWDIGK